MKRTVTINGCPWFVEQKTDNVLYLIWEHYRLLVVRNTHKDRTTFDVFGGDCIKTATIKESDIT